MKTSYKYTSTCRVLSGCRVILNYQHLTIIPASQSVWSKVNSACPSLIGIMKGSWLLPHNMLLTVQLQKLKSHLHPLILPPSNVRRSHLSLTHLPSLSPDCCKPYLTHFSRPSLSYPIHISESENSLLYVTSC